MVDFQAQVAVFVCPALLPLREIFPQSMEDGSALHRVSGIPALVLEVRAVDPAF